MAGVIAVVANLVTSGSLLLLFVLAVASEMSRLIAIIAHH